MALEGLAGLGAPVNYYESMVPDFRREALMETQNRVGQQQVAAAQRESTAAQQQAQQQQALMQELPGAMNDPAKLQVLALKYPSQLKNIQAQLGFRDAQDVDATEKAVNDLQIASSMGPQAIAQALVKHAGVIQQKGTTPQELMQMWAQDPQQFNSVLGTVKLGTLGAKDQLAVQNDQAQRNLTMRGQDLTAETARRGQDITVRGQNISAQNAALDREIKRAEVQDKVLDRQIARETNAIKLEELKQTQVNVRQKAEVARADRQASAQGAVDTFETALDSLNTITNSPGLKKAVGFNSAFPTIPGTDAANFEAQLDTFKAQTFLPMVQSLKGMGALSDAEGKKLSDAVGALSPKMSEEAFRKSAGTIEKTLQNKLQNVKKQYGYQEPAQTPQSAQPAQQQAGFSSLWGE